jgi:HAMP domain-containing protein
MISYVIPIYKGQTLLGVVGMDIDFDYLMNEVDRISVYETGHALVTDNNLNVIHSVHYPKGPLIDDFYNADSNFKIENLFSEETLYEYEFEGKKRKIAVKPLNNNMCLAVTVLASEINGSLNSLITIILCATIFVSIFAIVASFFLAYGITKPLSDLTRAAQEVSNGNLDVPINCNSQDEVGILSKIMQETVDKLKIRIEKMNVLAYTDNLTGVNNNTAYIHDIEKLVEQDKKFAIFIIDVNGLKIVNDTCGHDKGNELIEFINLTKITKEFYDIIEEENKKVVDYIERRTIDKSCFGKCCEYKKTTECRFKNVCFKKTLKDGSILEFIDRKFKNSDETETWDIYDLLNSKIYTIDEMPLDLINKKNVKIQIQGRHDSCIVPRAVPVVESAVAIALLDEIL